jgi:hypothetical protein
LIFLKLIFGTKFDVDKAAAFINVARKTLENRLAGLKREHKINVKATSGIRKATSRQRKAGSSPAKQQETKDGTGQELPGHSSMIEASDTEQSNMSTKL